MVIVCQKPAQARAPGGGGAVLDSCTPHVGFSAQLASIAAGILGEFPRYWRASSRAAAAINAPVAAIR